MIERLDRMAPYLSESARTTNYPVIERCSFHSSQQVSSEVAITT